MVDHKAVEFVLRLHKNTQSKKITWAPTFDGEIFETTFPRHTVRIERVLRRDAVDYVLVINNDQGIEVERFSDVDLSKNFIGEAPRDAGWFEFMGEIYDMARRQALKADEAIDAILQELE